MNNYYQFKRYIEKHNKKGYLKNIIEKIPNNPLVINEVVTSNPKQDP